MAISCDDWNTQRHGFDQRVGKPLHQGRQDKHLGLLDKGIGVFLETWEMDIGRHAQLFAQVLQILFQLPFAEDDQLQVRKLLMRSQLII